MDVTDKHIALLKSIENGAYGSEIPDDDDTCQTLSDLERMGLISWEATRIDDFYAPSKAGLAILAANG